MGVWLQVKSRMSGWELQPPLKELVLIFSLLQDPELSQFEQFQVPWTIPASLGLFVGLVFSTELTLIDRYSILHGKIRINSFLSVGLPGLCLTEFANKHFKPLVVQNKKLCELLGSAELCLSFPAKAGWRGESLRRISAILTHFLGPKWVTGNSNS